MCVSDQANVWGKQNYVTNDPTSDQVFIPGCLTCGCGRLSTTKRNLDNITIGDNNEWWNPLLGCDEEITNMHASTVSQGAIDYIEMISDVCVDN